MTQANKKLNIVFELELVPIQDVDVNKTKNDEATAVVFKDTDKTDIARVDVGGQTFGLLIGKTRVV